MNVNGRIPQTEAQQTGDAPLAVGHQANEDPVILDVDSPSPGLLALESGRQVRVDSSDHNRINVFSPDGTFELGVRFTPDGAVLTLSAASLDLRCSGELRVACKDLKIHAEHTATLEAGTWTEKVRETHSTVVGGQSTLEAHAVGIRSRLGDVAIDANDLVRVTGEKILLNH